MKFIIVHNIASPYRVHIFTEMHRQLSARGDAFHVHFMSDMSKGHGERPLSWRNPKLSFPHTYWKDYSIASHHFNPGLILRLIYRKSDVLMIGSAFDTFTGIALALFGRAGMKVAWTEGNTKTTGQMAGFKGFVKRMVFSRFRFVAVPGVEGIRYIELHQKKTRLKMPLPVLLPNLIDESRFKPRENWPPEVIARKRQELGCAETTRLCIIPARLEWYKGLVELFNALTPEILSEWKILIMGSGSLKGEIEDCLVTKGLQNHVVIQELVPYEEMPLNYAAADLFLLPSLMDRNPLSVPEALHSGLPVALSDRCGNVEEGVTDGSNGMVLHVLEEKRFEVELKEIFNMRSVVLQKMGRVSKLENAEFWNTPKVIGKFLDEIIT